MPRLTVDRAALERARAELSIEHPVRVAIVGPRLEAQGRYRGLKDGVHLITVSTRSTDPDATLWHELAHAAQRERFPSTAHYNAMLWQAAADAGIEDNADASDWEAYWSQPHEAEAKAIEEAHAGERLFVARHRRPATPRRSRRRVRSRP